MELGWLEARDFRCHREVSLQPAPGVNVFIGANGAGKTSILEAIGYLATLRSFRGATDGALVRAGAEAAVVRGEFAASSGKALVEIETPAEGRRRVQLNGKRPQSRAAVVATVALVAFLPDDLDLVKRGPGERRGFLDDLGAQVWPVAAAEQQDYERAVRQRNALLRQEGRMADPATLDTLDERVAALGALVLARRLETVAAVVPRVAALYEALGERTAAVGWRYEAAGLGALESGIAADALEEALGKALTEARPRDLERRLTTVGPHRDEMVLSLDDRDARTRASQGEQRSLALGLRLAAFELVEEIRGVRPILLLDDVFSELDPERSQRLVARLPGGQVFVTSARREEVPLEGTLWTVTEGKVRAA